MRSGNNHQPSFCIQWAPPLAQIHDAGEKWCWKKVCKYSVKKKKKKKLTTGRGQKFISGKHCFPLSSKSLSELSLELSHLLVCVSLPVLSLDGQLLGFLLGQQPAGRWQLLFQLLHSGGVPLHTQTTNRLGESWGDKLVLAVLFQSKLAMETSVLSRIFPPCLHYLHNSHDSSNVCIQCNYHFTWQEIHSNECADILK